MALYFIGRDKDNREIERVWHVGTNIVPIAGLFVTEIIADNHELLFLEQKGLIEKPTGQTYFYQCEAHEVSRIMHHFRPYVIV